MLCSSFVLLLIPQCPVLYCTLCIGIFKSATFGERIQRVWGLLSRPFLTQFPCTRCHIKEQGFGNKMHISDLFTVAGYLYTAGFKTASGQGINFAKCICSSHMIVQNPTQKIHDGNFKSCTGNIV